MSKLHNFLLIPMLAMTMPAVAHASTAQGGGAVAAQDAGKRDSAKKDRLICRRNQGFDTGSHLRSGKKCLRESEWKEREDSAQRFMRSVEERSGVHDIEPPGGPPAPQ